MYHHLQHSIERFRIPRKKRKKMGGKTKELGDAYRLRGSIHSTSTYIR
jgi:hypothetical protein